MLEGTVKLFDHRGFGFVRPSDGSEDIFFHCSELPGGRGKRSIDEGAYVQYELGTRNGRKVARNIRILVGAGGAE